ANLNSGDTVANKTPIYSLDQNSGWIDKNGDGFMTDDELHDENDISDNEFNINNELIEKSQDMGALFDSNGESLNLREGQGFWASYHTASTKPQPLQANHSGVITEIDIIINGVNIKGSYKPAPTIIGDHDAMNKAYTEDVAKLINNETGKTGVEARIVNGGLKLVNKNQSGTEDQMKNVDLEVISCGFDNSATPPGTDGTLKDTTVITAFKYTYSSTDLPPNHGARDSARSFTSTDDVRKAMQTDARLYTDYEGIRVGAPILDENGSPVLDANGSATFYDSITLKNLNRNDGVEVTVNKDGKFQITNPSGDAFNEDDGDIFDGTSNAILIKKTGAEFNEMLQKEGIVFGAGTELPAGWWIYDKDGNPLNSTIDIGGTTITKGSYVHYVAPPTTPPATPPATPAPTPAAEKVELKLGTDFKGEDDQDMFIAITAYSNIKNGININSSLFSIMDTLKGGLKSGDGVKTSKDVYAASSGAGINIYDSLGSKHDLRFDFTKIGYTSGGGTEWSILIKVPEPGEINDSGDGPKNIVTGTVSFGPDGSLSAYSPSSLTFSPNNGSSSNQAIELNLGSSNRFDGLTSFDRVSSVSSINQNGYAGGDLNDVRIDQNGVIVGTFSNGRSFGLAQISTAKFANNGGLENDGSNTFLKTSNSGEAVIGKAGTGGRASIQSSSLEMSNVDLSRSLTQLIIVQRGFQANSKTITTSDQLLNTLLSLKQ
nr:flagellar hook protein FlgE [Sulfurospirillum sp.]